MVLIEDGGEAMRCEHCGEAVTKGDKFCPACGKPLRAAETGTGGSHATKGGTGREARPDSLTATAAPEETPAARGEVVQPDGGGVSRRRKGGRKTVAVALVVAALAVVGALAWAFSAGPLQPVEERTEGSLPNVARAMTMWQDADKVRATLGVSDDEAESYAKDSLVYYPADLQGYDGWPSLYIDTTEGPSGGRGALDEVWVGFGGGGPEGTLAVVREGGKIKMYSGPADGGTYGTGPGAQNPYTLVGDLGDAPSAAKGQQAPALDDPTVAGLENALLQIGDKASYVRGFSPEDARALLGNLGFPEGGLNEDSSLYQRHTLDASISEAVNGLADSSASSGEPMTYGYQWRGKAQIDGRTVYLAVDASSGASVSLSSDMSRNGFYIPAQYLLTPYNPGVVVRCTFDEEHYAAWCEAEEGMEQSDQPFKTDVELSIEKNGDKAGVGTAKRDVDGVGTDEGAPAEAFAGTWRKDGGGYTLEIGEPAQSDGTNAGQSECTIVREKDATVYDGVWGYSPEGFEFQGRTYHSLVQIYGGEGETKLYLSVSKDRKAMTVIREEDGAFATWFAVE